MARAWLWMVLLIGAAVPAQASDVLRLGNGTEPETLDPQKTESVSASNIIRDLYEGLTAVGENGEIIPAAAQSWTRSEDGLTYTFTLRSDGFWSNGDPVVAEDFVAGMRRSVNPATGAPAAGMLDIVENAQAVLDGQMPVEKLGVRARDPHTVEIRLHSPAPFLPGLLTHPIGFAIHRPSLAQYGNDFTKPGRLVSNGAYQLQEWLVQSHITLVRNPHYRTRAPIAEVRHINTEDVSSELQRYRAGELDVTYDIPPLQVQRMQKRLPGQLRITPYLGIYYFGLNLTRPPLKDQPGLRQALSMLIDREVIVNKVMQGLGQPAYGWVPPATAGAIAQEPQWAQWTYAERVAKARELYHAAGYSDANPLEIEIRFNTHESHRRLAIVMAAMWRQTLGIRAHLVNEEFKVFLANRRLRKVTQVFRSGWIADFDDPVNFLDILRAGDDRNDTGWDNPRYRQLLDQAQNTADPDARAQLLAQAEQQVLQDTPVIPIYYYVSKHLVSPRLRGWHDNALDTHYSKDLSFVAEGAR